MRLSFIIIIRIISIISIVVIMFCIRVMSFC